MSDDTTAAASVERLLADELVHAAKSLLDGVTPDERGDAYAVRLATVQVLLAMFWELRHHGLTTSTVDTSLEWVSALVCSGPW